MSLPDQDQASRGAERRPVFAQPWVCRRCGASQDEPETVWQNARGYFYRAPCCGPCGQFFSAEDIARFDVAAPPTRNPAEEKKDQP